MTEKQPNQLAEAVGADITEQAVPAPPPGLTEQTVEAMLAGGAAPADERAVEGLGRRFWPVLAALAAGMLIGGPAWLALRASTGGNFRAGDREPSAQETIRLQDRAVLVAEAGARLRWRPGPENAVLVEQNAGEVFYRVNAGRFLVETPFGVVRVTGTCFRVEVSDMKRINRQTVSAATIGAALGAAVVVTVYEGQVLLAKERSQVTLAAGQTGQITSSGLPERLSLGAPQAGTAMPGGRPSLPRFDDREVLRNRIAEQDKELAQLRPGAPLANKLPEGKKRFLEPSREELLARVERCELAYDSPSINGLRDKDVQKLGLSDGEREAVNEALNEAKKHVIGEMRRLYIEMSGDSAMADRLSPPAMETEIFARAPDGARGRARQQLARERAGLVPPPADMAKTPVAERTIRLMSTIGDLFEKKLADRIGAQRARSLRSLEDGWGGKTVTNGCD